MGFLMQAFAKHQSDWRTLARTGRRPNFSGNEIHTGCLSLSRLDFLSSLDLILIRFDLGGGCAACFVCYEPDFRLTDDNMRRVRGTDVTHVPSLPWSNSNLAEICSRFIKGFG